VACLRPLPAPRVDAHDRVVADTDQEMARITGQLTARFDTVARREPDVALDAVVRFGAAARELRVEVEAVAPDRVVFFEAPTAPLASRVRGWRLRWRRPGWNAVPLVVIETPRPARGSALRPSVRVLRPPLVS
jgi:hypothetical protein